MKKLGTGLLFASIFFAFMAAAADQKAINPSLTQVTSSTQREYEGPLEKAGKFVAADARNVGIYIVYGKSNNVTPEQAGEWAKEKLQKYAAEQSKNYETAYFIAHTDKWQGISISYLVGVAQEVGPLDLRKAKDPLVLDEVFQKRDRTARLLQ